MDGFESNEGVIMMAATNRPDVLDPALLRPGRFDRRVVVDAPDMVGRLGILKVHSRRTPLADDVNLDLVARNTPGFSGADLENLVNEAALLAARFNKKKVEMDDFEAARDKVFMGPARRKSPPRPPAIRGCWRCAIRSSTRPRPRRPALAQGRRRPQGHDHPPRSGDGRHLVPA